MIIPGTAQEQHKKTDTVSVTVRIEGKDVTMNPGGLVSLSIGMEVNKIPWARLVLADGSVEKGTFEKSNSDTFSPGKAVEILMGYHQKQETVFKGIITRHAVKILAGSHYKLELECKDAAVKTTVVKRSLYYYDKNDKDIVKQILKNYAGLQVGEMQGDGPKHESLVQYNVTDWDFMLLRADANGLFLRVQDGKLNMIKPELKSTPDVQVQFGVAGSGTSVQEFESEIDVRNHYPGVKGHTWDEAQQAVVEQTAGKVESSGAGGALGGLVSQVASAIIGAGGTAKKDFPDVLYGKDNTVGLYHEGRMDSSSLKAWVNAKHKRGELSRIRGRATVNGVRLLPGDTVQVNGVSDRFNGKHLVTGVLHQYLRGHWKTDIQFGWEREFVADELSSSLPGGGALVPGIGGLHTGIVSKVKGDSKSMEHRVQVRIPFLAKNSNGSSSQGVWARLGNVYAGSGRGFVFRPEVNDEVIVGFINGDPNDAIVIGTLHSGKNDTPDPIKASDQNEKKGYVAKGGMQFIFDDTKQTVLLSASGDNGPRIEIDGKGSKISIVLNNSTSIELSSSGVKVSGSRIDLN